MNMLLQRTAVIFVVLGSSILAMGQGTVKLPILSSVALHVEEPSDISLISADATGHFYVVSDKGTVAEVDASGERLRSSGQVGYDIEGCLVHDGHLLVVDERTRRLIRLNMKDLTVERQRTFPYAGARNKGYEAVGWNERKGVYVLITERDPVYILELDTAMQVVVNELNFDRSVRDVSACAWYDGAFWMLSDMDREILRCDPLDYHIIARYSIAVINPEGLTIDASGLAWVTSDDRQRLYSFQLPR